MRFYIFLIIVFITINLRSQNLNLLLNNNLFYNYEEDIYLSNKLLHTSFKPLIKSDINIFNDTMLNLIDQKNNNLYYRKLFTEHLFIINQEDYKIIASPVIDLNIGKEFDDNKMTYVNTRGYFVEGNLGHKVSFHTSFRENQSIFPNYVHNYIKENKIVPGQGYARIFKDSGYDYSMSSGYVSIKPSKFFIFQFGHGKHFIGDGYRSLLLSDNTFNYPFLRIQSTFWKIKYTNLYTELQDINYFQNNGINNYDQMGYAKKYMSSHYLDINLHDKLSIALFESVIWKTNHAPGNSGFDVNYLNPIILLRPIEYSLNSPDNVLVGLNSKYKIINNAFLYGQLILDEFSLNELRRRDGFWGNKFGYQLGGKVYNAFNVNSLRIQFEYNYVRPYTYAHHNPQQNYGHYNQPLAHPLGANFSEILFLSYYKWNKFEITSKIIFAKYGAQYLDNSISYGGDIYMSTGNFGEIEEIEDIGSGRPSDFGIEMYQGNITKLKFNSIDISYIVNPVTNLKVNIGLVLRSLVSEESIEKTRFFNIGIRSDLFNNYYDF